VSGAESAEFGTRARLEADRYGPDPWVFVRELLQNARDAGATRVRFSIAVREDHTVLSCSDDGEGMSFEHARRFLFSLYASSKEGDATQVGRFGVGFWSVLRFEPSRIVVRSGAAGGEPWEIALDGDLRSARHTTPSPLRGTQVVLERPGIDPSLARRVRDAAAQNARFLTRRGAPGVPVAIDVDGECVNAPFELPAPSAAFSRGGVRGVVALGVAPRVELFSRGLRVRSAAALDDLLSNAEHTRHARVRFPELPGALAPQALLEAPDVELLLSRSDAREDRSLRRLVRLAHAELARLVDRQLAAVRPPGLGERIAGWWHARVGDSLLPRLVLAAGVGVLLALGSARILWGPVPPPLPGGHDGALAAVPAPAAEEPATGGYRDLAARYRGPRVSELDPAAYDEATSLSYRPTSAAPHLAALVLSDFDGGAAPLLRGADGRLEPYRGTVCATECLELELELDGEPGTLRIPVPTGHRLDVESVALDGRRVVVLRTGNDEPALHLTTPTRGTLSYRTGPAVTTLAAVPDLAAELPADLRRQARALRRRPIEDRVAQLQAIVRARVRYSVDAQVGARHHEAIVRGESFVSRTLRIGAGDCDVQNGLLVALLHAADVPARLAVGYVGAGGQVAPWLHAWAEYRDTGDRWRVADASATAAGRLGAPPPAAASNAAPPTAAPPIVTAPPIVAAPPPAPEPAPTLPAVASAPSLPTTAWLAAGAGASGLALTGGLVAFGRRTRRRIRLDEAKDLSRLLHGALQRPAAFRHLPALFRRRLIPLIDARAISLDRARELAARGRLLRSRGEAALAVRARRRGIDVLDDRCPEARSVADTLGATDLDHWSRVLDQARPLPVLAELDRYLREVGERWRTLILPSGATEIESLDLRNLGLGRATGRLVVIPAADERVAEAERLWAHRPATALLVLLDHLLERLDFDPDRRATLLAPQARAALQELSR
jgi:hypothetical protein